MPFSEFFPDFPMAFFPSGVPANELRDGEPVSCDLCSKQITDLCYLDNEHTYCEGCTEALVKKLTGEAVAFAQENCVVTREFPKYDPSREFRCTPEQYENGDRESYTPNAYICHCRHTRTNYDDLIAGLDRDSIEDRVYYDAIRNRVDELVRDGIDSVMETDEDEYEEEL
jgi:hypothetical protein